MDASSPEWRQWRTGALPEGDVPDRASAAGGMTARGTRSCLALRVNHFLRLGRDEARHGKAFEGLLKRYFG